MARTIVTVSQQDGLGDHSLLPASWNWAEYQRRLQARLGDGFEVRLATGPGPIHERRAEGLYSIMLDVVDDYAADLDKEDALPKDDDLRDLRREAAAVGDDAQVRLCDQALAGDVVALEECAAVMADARAQA